MPELPVSSEMVAFAVNVARGTTEDKLEWEVTADEDILLAPLGGQYTAKLELVTRQDSDGDEYPSYELALIKGRDELFRLDAPMLSGTSFAKSLKTDRSYPILRDMWNRAILKARKVTEELNEVNRILEARLGPIPPVDDEDDDVPF